MGILNRQRLSELLSVRSEYCLSMYLATPGAETGHRRDRIRLSELLLQAEDQLVAGGLERGEARKLLLCGEELRWDDDFWTYCGDGVALFVALDWFRVFRAPQRFRDLVCVGSRFCVRPLLPLLLDDGRFYVLALTADNARLYQATRQGIHEVSVPGLMNSSHPDWGQHQRSTTVAGPSSSPTLLASEAEVRDTHSRADLLHFFRQVDEAVRTVLEDVNAPLVLASMGYLAGLYEEANSYSHLLREKVPGSPGIWSIHELREQAWQMVAPRFGRRRDQAAATFRSLVGTAQASEDIREIAQAAAAGRVATLLVNSRRVAELDGQGDRPLVPAYDQGCLENLDPVVHTITRTVSYGGDVFAVEGLPGDVPLAAVFRN